MCGKEFERKVRDIFSIITLCCPQQKCRSAFRKLKREEMTRHYDALKEFKKIAIPVGGKVCKRKEKPLPFKKVGCEIFRAENHINLGTIIGENGKYFLVQKGIGDPVEYAKKCVLNE